MINTGKHLWHVDAGLMQVPDEKHLENTSGMLMLVLLPSCRLLIRNTWKTLMAC